MTNFTPCSIMLALSLSACSLEERPDYDALSNTLPSGGPTLEYNPDTGLDNVDAVGFTHICSTRRSDGGFSVRRKTQRTKLHKKIKEVQQQLMKHRAIHIEDQVKWIRSVIIGHRHYYGVPGNSHALSQFRKEVCRSWFRALRRRSDKARKLS